MNPKNAHIHGFTVLEVLVATMVMAIVFIIMLQIVNGILGATTVQRQQMDSVAAARRALDVIATDLQSAVAGNTSAILVPDSTGGTDLLALVASRGGPAGSTGHRFLAVRYSTNSNNELFRHYSSVNYTTANLLQAAAGANSTVNSPLARGILQIRIQALADSPNSYPAGAAAAPNWATNNYNGIPVPPGYKALLGNRATFASGLANRTRALEVSIAAIDTQNMRILTDTGKLETARAPLSGDPGTWRSGVDAAAIPPTAKSGIRILKKTIPMP